MIVHCLFEQSGTFKNEFKKLGIQAYDYDILNDFNETDYQIDLFNEINKAYDNKSSIFDNITKEDLIFAFFPCTRFENQAIMLYQGTHNPIYKKPLEYKLELDLKLHKELHDLYTLVTKLAIVAMRGGYKMIIENPYSKEHYLTRYWCVKPAIIDKNRRESGDYYVKPTQYYFFNLEQKCNLLWEYPTIQEKKLIVKEHNQVQRSMISKEYANRFIREYIL